MAKKIEQGIRQEYRTLMEKWWNGDQHMVDYCCRKADVLYKVRDVILEIEKPTIKTRFCFGYSTLFYDSQSYDDASALAQDARTNTSIFISENLWDLDQWVRGLENKDTTIIVRNHDKSAGFAGVMFVDPWKVERFNQHAEEFGGICFVPTPEERQVILEAYKQARENFRKRLATYLKRYGLSKIESWTYWQDE